MPTFNAFSAAQIIQQANDKSAHTAAQVEQVSQRDVLAAKTKQVQNAKSSQDGTTLDSGSKFVASAAGCLTNAKLAAKGAQGGSIRQMKEEADAAFAMRQQRAAALAPSYSALAQGGSVTQLIGNGNDALSQTVGGQAEVNKAKIADKQAELAETSAKMVQEAAKSMRDEANKGQDSVQEMVKGAFDRAAQVINKVFA